MLSIHFNKQFFINSLKTNSKLVIYISTTLAIFLMILMHGLIQGNLQPEFFGYALIVTAVFYIWDIIDHSQRKQRRISPSD
ncbi:hypothetical protein ACK2M2_07030 [Acinetobacter sp. TY1]|uniref:hypothetical protein n=1 Tax=unclassified Acinetobacter TaxID=196816 RepID=UPI00304D7683